MVPHTHALTFKYPLEKKASTPAHIDFVPLPAQALLWPICFHVSLHGHPTQSHPFFFILQSRNTDALYT